jgi:hypothetical protein
LSLLELLAESESMMLTQLAQELATSKTSAFRLASSLLDRGWLAKKDDLRYRSAGCPNPRMSRGRANGVHRPGACRVGVGLW